MEMKVDDGRHFATVADQIRKDQGVTTVDLNGQIPDVGSTQTLNFVGDGRVVANYQVVVESVENGKAHVRFVEGELGKLAAAAGSSRLSGGYPSVGETTGNEEEMELGLANDEVPAGRLRTQSAPSKASGFKPSQPTRKMPVHPIVAAAGVLLLAGLLFAFTAGSTNQDTEMPPPQRIPTVYELGLAQVTNEIPISPAGERLSWTIDRLNGVAPLSAEEFNQVFSDDVLARASAETLVSAVEELTPQAPYQLVGFVETPTDYQLTGVLQMSNGDYRAAIIEVEVAEPHRLSQLNIQNRP